MAKKTVQKPRARSHGLEQRLATRGFLVPLLALVSEKVIFSWRESHFLEVNLLQFLGMALLQFSGKAIINWHVGKVPPAA